MRVGKQINNLLFNENFELSRFKPDSRGTSPTMTVLGDVAVRAILDH